MMKEVALFRWLALFLILVTATSCSLLESQLGTPEPTEEPAAGQLVYPAPYRAVLDAGESVPGADLEYVGEDDQGIHVRIGGQDAYKKVGDSFNWRGNPAPGVELDYKLRIVGVYLGVFQAWGQVDIIISDPVVAVAELPEEAPFVFSAVVVDHTVPRGEAIPGTTLTYLGSTERGAEFGGLDGYAFREVADSLDWSGQVRDNVFVDLQLRVRAIDEDEVKVIGTATVWILTQVG
jgi:hypothetical protein